MAAGAKLRDASLRVSLPHEPSSVWIARHALAEQLTADGVWPQDRDDALLVLSELVSNAVKHAAALASGQITCRWQVDDDLLHIEVTDGGAGTHPQATVAAMSALGGRGLDLVRTLSRQWGVTGDDGTVTVWAEVPRTTLDASGYPASPGIAAH